MVMVTYASRSNVSKRPSYHPSPRLFTRRESRHRPVCDPELLQHANYFVHARKIAKHARIPLHFLAEIHTLLHHAHNETDVASIRDHLHGCARAGTRRGLVFVVICCQHVCLVGVEGWVTHGEVGVHDSH